MTAKKRKLTYSKQRKRDAKRRKKKEYDRKHRLYQETTRCGGCKLCCKVYPIPEVDKPGGVWCKHAKGKGCAIYADRPASCVDFTCLYLEHGLPIKYRPDKIGCVLALQAKNIVTVSQSDNGAYENREVQELIESLAACGCIVVVYGVDGSPVAIFSSRKHYPTAPSCEDVIAQLDQSVTEYMKSYCPASEACADATATTCA